MATLSIVKSAEPRTWVLEDDRQAVGSLYVGRAATTGGEVRAVDGAWPIACQPHHWRRVAVGEPTDPIVELARQTAVIPGFDEHVPWEIRGTVQPLPRILAPTGDRAAILAAGAVLIRHGTRRAVTSFPSEPGPNCGRAPGSAASSAHG